MYDLSKLSANTFFFLILFAEATYIVIKKYRQREYKFFQKKNLKFINIFGEF